MRKTNCKRMTRMMPLYVAGDLVGEPEREAAAHLAACQACRQLAEQFSESSSLLSQAFAQPQFDAEFYAGIRREVLGQIAVGRNVSKPSMFGRSWGRRWVYAASLAAVVIAAVMLQVFRDIPRHTSGSTHQVSGQPTPGETNANSPSARQLSGSQPKSLLATTQTGQSNKLRRSRTQIEPAREPDAQDTVRIARDVRKEIAPAAPSSVALKSVTPTSPSTSSPSGLASSSELSRIEIQTADPKIRIIWLAPRDSRKSEETNHDHDPENGDRN
ncbi:MAG TPA: zf-HC2 domain-containing protein [Pyrinomonadaceae bacterium]|nr:zf-HC2 domain-containing protein [Pyrinomonadaceae bacterium]